MGNSKDNSNTLAGKINQNDNSPDNVLNKFERGPDGRLVRSCDTHACAEYANTRIVEIFNNSLVEDLPAGKRNAVLKKVGSFGNAWENQDNIVKAGGKALLNLYKGKVNPNIDKELKDGDVVGMDYPASTGNPFDLDANGKPRMTTRHQGIVRVDNAGNKYIEHNIHGDMRGSTSDPSAGVYLDPIEVKAPGRMTIAKPNDNYGQWLIVSVSRPNYAAAKPKVQTGTTQVQEGEFTTIPTKKVKQLPVDLTFKPTNKTSMAVYAFGGYIKKYAKGGSMIEPQYEVEGNEVVQGTDTMLEGQEQLASDMVKAVGPDHANGGVKGEGGERVFSDRLYVSPMLRSYLSANKVSLSKKPTYGEAAEKLGKKKGKFEDKLTSGNPLTFNTGKAMTTRIDQLIELTFQEQESLKQEDEMKTTYAKGGRLPKYYVGGKRPVVGAINPDTGKAYSEQDADMIEAGGDFNNPFDGWGKIDKVGYANSTITPSTKISAVSSNSEMPMDWKETTIPFKGSAYKANSYGFTGGNTTVNSYVPKTISKTSTPAEVASANPSFKGLGKKVIDGVDFGQTANLGVYMSNLKNANKQKTGITRTVAKPTYMRNVNMLPYAKQNISKEASYRHYHAAARSLH